MESYGAYEPQRIDLGGFFSDRSKASNGKSVLEPSPKKQSFKRIPFDQRAYHHSNENNRY